MASPDPELDARRMDEVHAAVRDGSPLMPLIAPWGMNEAKRIIGLVQDEYIDDLNRAIRGQSHDLDTQTFRARYDALWAAKLDLDRARYAENS
jgi:hypothetical protein